MPKRKVITSTSREDLPSLRPALTPEGRINQLTMLAYDLVEQRLLDGTATSQETTHFLKLGSPRNQLEEEKLRKEIELLEAKKADLEAREKTEELYSKAMKAFLFCCISLVVYSEAFGFKIFFCCSKYSSISVGVFLYKSRQ